MATIKQERQALEQLLNGVAPLSSDPVNSNTTMNLGTADNPIRATTSNNPVQTTAAIVDNTNGASMTPEMAFNFDYDSIKKGIRKKARKTVFNIISHIIPQQYQNEDYVQDKAEQDITTLTDLYMQLEVNNIMQRSLMESVARGNSMPRMYEVFGQLSDKISAINKQILGTEQTIRKTYLDLKFEIHDKEAENINMNQLTAGNSTGLISGGNRNIVTSSKQLIEMAKKKHIEKMNAMNNIKETEFIEEN